MRDRRGFALVELLVVVTTLAIVIAIGVFTFEELSTTPVDRTCSQEAQAFANEVQMFKADHGYLPGTKQKNVVPSVLTASLALFGDGESKDGIPAHTRYGTATNQWVYNAKTGKVTQGASCI